MTSARERSGGGGISIVVLFHCSAIATDELVQPSSPFGKNKLELFIVQLILINCIFLHIVAQRTVLDREYV